MFGLAGPAEVDPMQNSATRPSCGAANFSESADCCERGLNYGSPGIAAVVARGESALPFYAPRQYSRPHWGRNSRQTSPCRRRLSDCCRQDHITSVGSTCAWSRSPLASDFPARQPNFSTHRHDQSVCSPDPTPNIHLDGRPRARAGSGVGQRSSLVEPNG